MHCIYTHFVAHESRMTEAQTKGEPWKQVRLAPMLDMDGSERVQGRMLPSLSKHTCVVAKADGKYAALDWLKKVSQSQKTMHMREERREKCNSYEQHPSNL